MRRVLVTRPEPGAGQTAQRLSALGFAPLVLPLTRIVPLPPPVSFQAVPWSAVAITSPNAVRHAPRGLLGALAGLPVHAVGEGSAAAARAAGLAHAAAAAGDAERLAQQIVAQRAPGRILLLCGRVRRDTLERRLSAAGFGIDVLETYDTLPARPAPQAVAALLGGAPVQAALFHSAFAARLFAPVLEQAPRCFADTLFIAISPRVAESLPPRTGGRVAVAARPTEEAMFARLAGGM